MKKIIICSVVLSILLFGCLSNSSPQSNDENQSINITNGNQSLSSAISINQTAKVDDKLNSSFCQSLENKYTKTACNEYVGVKANDQRIRDYIVHIDSIGVDMDETVLYKKQMDIDISKWNSAQNITELKEAYDSFYINAKLYINIVNSMDGKINDLLEFLKENKDYLDSQGINTQSEINTFKSFKTDLRSGMIISESYFSTMSGTLNLSQTEKEDADNLLNSMKELEVKLNQE